MKLIRCSFILFLSLALMACATLKLPAPASTEASLLLLPFTVDNRSQHGGPLGFHYSYEIVNLNGEGDPLKVTFIERMDADVVVIDSLPPGDYQVSSISFVPAGSGEHTYGDNRQPLNIDFKLEAGAITILPFSLNIELYNSIPGRGMSTSYSSSLTLVSEAQRGALIKRLDEQETYAQWKLLN